MEGRRPPVDIERRKPAEALENVLKLLEEQHKLPRRIVMTRWLSSMDAVKVMATSRETYKNFFEHETSEPGKAIFDQLWNNFIFAWYYCLPDVLPVLTGMKLLFYYRTYCFQKLALQNKRL